jgi:hypothetical protein
MQPPSWSVVFWPYLAEPGECWELARAARHARLFATLTLASWLPSYRARSVLREGALAALDGRSTSRRAEL